MLEILIDTILLCQDHFISLVNKCALKPAVSALAHLPWASYYRGPLENSKTAHLSKKNLKNKKKNNKYLAHKSGK